MHLSRNHGVSIKEVQQELQKIRVASSKKASLIFFSICSGNSSSNRVLEDLKFNPDIFEIKELHSVSFISSIVMAVKWECSR